MEQLLKVSYLSKKWNVSMDQLYRWIKDGSLPARKSEAGTIRVSEKDADAFWAEKDISEKT